MPLYRDAVYGGETVVLENQHLRLEMHKRRTGWGWGELFVPDGQGGWRFFAVLDHLAEMDAEGLPHPLRLEAPEVTRTSEGGVETLRFAVRTQEVEPPDRVFGGESPLAGTVELSLGADAMVIEYRLDLQSQFLFYLRRLRGPWLKVGADSFGAAKADAIFPGIEWLEGAEWSSGTEWFDHPERLRLTPHPHKVAIPCLALSQSGMGVGLWYEPDAQLTVGIKSYPHTLVRFPQPVFASPNFIDNRNEHVLGLMWPSARQGLQENALSASPGLKCAGTRFVTRAQIAVVPGTSLDVVLAWVKAHGMPEPGAPRWPWKEAYDKIIRAYDTNLWREGEGFALRWAYRGKGAPDVPPAVREYLQTGDDPALVESLRRKVEWCDQQKLAEQANAPHPTARVIRYIQAHPDETVAVGEQLLAIQTLEGDFPFDPEGRHNTGHNANAAYWRPLGLAGESAVDLCATAVLALFAAWDTSQRAEFRDAAHKSLEFALRFQRPEGGDWWETPLRSPNLLAAGNAAMAYYRGFQILGDERYRERAIHWIRSMIPFTHLWQPRDVKMLYNTKPCFNTTAWFLSDWVSKHVQWEVLQVLRESDKLGIDWAVVDPEVDWHTYHRGVTTAVLRWFIDHTDEEWMFQSEYPSETIGEGQWDMLWADTFDPVKNSYGGGPISAGEIAGNIQIVMRYAD